MYVCLPPNTIESVGSLLGGFNMCDLNLCGKKNASLSLSTRSVTPRNDDCFFEEFTDD